MSSITWTPDALRSDFKHFAGECWRVVESQYVISTNPLVDNLVEQARLEELIEGTKPPIPPECRHLDVLLFTPFRYPAKYGSRFRRIGQREGVFYTAATVETAMAEMAFYRVLFFAESPGTPLPGKMSEYTAFSVEIATERLVDIAPDADASLRDLSDYSACQVFADLARAAEAEGVRSASVRCPSRGVTYSWLTCRVFVKPAPVRRQTWRMRVTPTSVQALCESPRLALEFQRSLFESDPRVAPRAVGAST